MCIYCNKLGQNKFPFEFYYAVWHSEVREYNVCAMLRVVNYQTSQECASSGQFRMTFHLNRGQILDYEILHCKISYYNHSTRPPHVTVAHRFPLTHNNF